MCVCCFGLFCLFTMRPLCTQEWKELRWQYDTNPFPTIQFPSNSNSLSLYSPRESTASVCFFIVSTFIFVVCSRASIFVFVMHRRHWLSRVNAFRTTYDVIAIAAVAVVTIFFPLFAKPKTFLAYITSWRISRSVSCLFRCFACLFVCENTQKKTATMIVSITKSSLFLVPSRWKFSIFFMLFCAVFLLPFHLTASLFDEA